MVGARFAVPVNLASHVRTWYTLVCERLYDMEGASRMYAVEFQTNIMNGIIEVPEPYRHQLSGSVRVLILTDAASKDVTTADARSTNLITRLLAHPRKVVGFTPLKRDEIYERR